MTYDEYHEQLRKHVNPTPDSEQDSPWAQLAGVKIELENLVNACQAELGYEDGDLLSNIKRYKKWAKGEIEVYRAGNRRISDYAGKLQEMLKPEQFLPLAQEVAMEGRGRVWWVCVSKLGSPSSQLFTTKELAGRFRELRLGFEIVKVREEKE